MIRLINLFHLLIIIITTDATIFLKYNSKRHQDCQQVWNPFDKQDVLKSINPSINRNCLVKDCDANDWLLIKENHDEVIKFINSVKLNDGLKDTIQQVSLGCYGKFNKYGGWTPFDGGDADIYQGSFINLPTNPPNWNTYHELAHIYGLYHGMELNSCKGHLVTTCQQNCASQPGRLCDVSSITLYDATQGNNKHKSDIWTDYGGWTDSDLTYSLVYRHGFYDNTCKITNPKDHINKDFYDGGSECKPPSKVDLRHSIIRLSKDYIIDGNLRAMSWNIWNIVKTLPEKHFFDDVFLDFITLSKSEATILYPVFSNIWFDMTLNSLFKQGWSVEKSYQLCSSNTITTINVASAWIGKVIGSGLLSDQTGITKIYKVQTSARSPTLRQLKTKQYVMFKDRFQSVVNCEIKEEGNGYSYACDQEIQGAIMQHWVKCKAGSLYGAFIETSKITKLYQTNVNIKWNNTRFNRLDLKKVVTKKLEKFRKNT